MAESLPLFPLGTVLMPGTSLPLHVFEPRYRQLTIDLVTGTLPGREFGVIAVREGWAPDDDGIHGLHRVGCTAELRDVRKLPDGRFDIVTRGSRRFRLMDLDAESRPYLVGTVEWLPDVPDEGTSEERVLGLTSAARAAHQRYCETAWRAEEWREPAHDVDFDTLPHLLAADCLLPMRDRQLLLEQTCPTRRLRMVRALLCREATLLAELRAVPAPLSSYAVEHSDN
ncbi:MAG TPA: LON peptidase substrate-binding domain-containing protein [Pseudonocardia sp.]|nr:LON peptidase substrate-binding domain-containing protein [Pseudonocardia sp.]